MISQRIEKERHENRISLNNMIFFSLLLHTLVLSAILFSSKMPSPRWTFGPVYDVELVSISNDQLKEGHVSSTSTELMEANINKRSIIPKKIVDNAIIPLMRSSEIQKKQKGVEKTIENIRQKVLSLSKTQGRTASPLTDEGTVASSGGRGNAELDAEIKAYYTLIWKRIKSQWVLPPDVLSGKDVETVIHLRILKNRSATDINFEKRSGNHYFDESAMKAIEKAVPFPPLPEGIKDNSIEVGVRFHSAQMW
ncbi:MAG: TonB family protein [Syntrophales bacterium]